MKPADRVAILAVIPAKIKKSSQRLLLALAEVLILDMDELEDNMDVHALRYLRVWPLRVGTQIFGWLGVASTQIQEKIPLYRKYWKRIFDP